MGKTTKSTAPDREITQSEIGVFRTCRRKHELRYTRGLSRIRSARPLRVGSAVHEGARAWLAMMVGLTPIEVVLRSEAADDAGLRAMREYLARVESQLHGDEDAIRESVESEREAEAAYTGFTSVARGLVTRYEVVAIEMPVSVKLARGYVLRGQLDIVLRDRERGRIVLGEIKTTRGNASTEDFRDDVDPQPRLYLYALRKVYGPSAVDPIAVYVTVRKKGPSITATTKKGLVSAARIDTTRDIYAAALAEQERNGIPVTDEQAALLSQLGGVDRYASVREVWYAPEDIASTAAEALITAREIARTEAGRMRVVRNGHSCTSRSSGVCEFREVCDGRSEPSPMLYQIRANRHAEIVETAEEADSDAA